ncbi:lysoplasmalogenase [Streptomyces sp. NPDC059037]|uniref:lysoplasmalogenase n=1 Tax=Streptomyces sp. NPDC059037 TaxID=3346710 RepID=UPI0036B3FCE4
MSRVPVVGRRSARRNGWAQPQLPGTDGAASTKAKLLLAAFALAALGDLTALLVDADTGHTIFKPLLMPLLAAYVVTVKGPRLLTAALLFGWGGDTLLLFDADPAFLAGMGSFAAGHVCYLVLFKRYGKGYGTARARGAGLVAAYAAALVTTVALLWPDLPADMRGPVAGYSLLLTAMAFGATTLGLTAAAGGALFLLSDTLIATGVAEWPQAPRPDFWIMLTYIAAQFLLVRGVLAALNARTAPNPTYGEGRTSTP